ncbi:hypothetical protein BC941DRAFT_455504 [Chlamydoabsidia padenii]|nr:hypothetical protein BC941DRAFT_455504 [Chlamydoabsidia padenii]
MADSIIARHTPINAGAMPASAEELNQKHQALFQEYSRLKTRHAVLKKAVKKERTDNVLLQGDVKEKEEELRKLQGQLDILAFHNERLSKRIEAVQEIETKGSHFSLLGGAIKKELQKSTQALDATNMDLTRKIEENEGLRIELSEVNHIYTNNLNKLYVQIAALEKRIEELQDERTFLQSENSSQSSVLIKEKDNLIEEITRLQNNLAEKIQLLDEYQQGASNDGDQTAVTEKDLTVTQLKAQLANQATIANQQIESLENDIKSLEDTIAQLHSQHTNISDENTTRLEQQVADMEATIKQLGSQQQSELATESVEKTMETMEKDLSDLQQANDLLKEANAKLESEKATLTKENTTLRIDTADIIAQLTDEVKKKKDILDTMEKKIIYLENQLEEQQQQISLMKQQVDFYEKAINAQESTEQEDIKNDNENDHSFVYPVSTKDTTATTNMTEIPEDDGRSSSDDKKDTRNIEALIQERENKLKQYYESRMNQLTEKFQMADSKASRFAGLVNSLKEKLVEETEQKQGLRNEIQTLQEEVVKAKESLSTTESKYQEQLDMLTEYTTSLQMQVSKAQTQSPTI